MPLEIPQKDSCSLLLIHTSFIILKSFRFQKQSHGFTLNRLLGKLVMAYKGVGDRRATNVLLIANRQNRDI